MNEQLGRSIRAVRESRGTSLRALAAQLQISPATLSAIERGLTGVSVSRLETIAQALDVPLSSLLEGEAAAPARSAPGGGSHPAAHPAWRDFDELGMDQVLEAATRLFVRQGYHATSMREIASEAGLSVAGVYHHYPSKERILVALLDVTMAEIAWRLEAARLEGRDACESFSLMVEALALFHAVRGDLAFIGASEMRAFGPEERVRVTALRDAVQHALDRQAERCVLEFGDADVRDVRTATRAVATMCTSLPSWFRLDGPLSAAEVARRYAQYAVAMIARSRA